MALPRLGRSAVPPDAAAATRPAPGSDRLVPSPAAPLLLLAAAGASTSSSDRAADMCLCWGGWLLVINLD